MLMKHCNNLNILGVALIFYFDNMSLCHFNIVVFTIQMESISDLREVV